jgi:hypothetical protein
MSALLNGVKYLLAGLAVLAVLAFPSGGSTQESTYDRRERAYEATRSAFLAEESEQDYQNDLARERDLIIQRLDDEADEYLAAEKAVATWWRRTLTETSDESGQRTGTLIQYPRVTFTPDGPRNEVIEYECDPNYEDALTGGCVPADRDYDCEELRSWGIAQMLVIGDDWMLLDDDHDGVGCEVEPRDYSNVVRTAQAVVPTPEPTPETDNPCDGLVGTLGCFLFGP